MIDIQETKKNFKFK